MTQFALGIDIGGTNTAYGIVNRRGDILHKGSMPTTGHNTVHDYLAALVKHISPFIEDVGLANMLGVGVGAPNGNFFTGEIAHAPNLPWKGVIPLAKLLADTLHLKTTLTNDANAAAIGEMMYGAARGMNDFIVVTLGTGLGSGFVANGKLVYGHDGFAGELGHVTAVRGGRLCGCGRKGCLETYASATGLVRTADEWLTNRNDHTALRDFSGRLTSHIICTAAENGDAFAIELFNYAGTILGQTLADTVAITSPQAIIFFGGLAKAGDLLLAPTRKAMEENMLFVYKNKVELLYSSFQDADAAILGASALVW